MHSLRLILGVTNRSTNFLIGSRLGFSTCVFCTSEYSDVLLVS